MRIAHITFEKNYREVVEKLSTLVKNAVVTEREEMDRKVIEIEGDFEHFILEDMDFWREYLKFEIKDNHVSDEDRDIRSHLAEQIPGWGNVLFALTIAFVYKRVTTSTRTTTITERVVNGAVIGRDEKVEESEPVYEWEEITREFGRKVKVER